MLPEDFAASAAEVTEERAFLRFDEKALPGAAWLQRPEAANRQALPEKAGLNAALVRAWQESASREPEKVAVDLEAFAGNRIAAGAPTLSFVAPEEQLFANRLR